MEKNVLKKCFELFNLSETEIRGIAKKDVKGYKRTVSGYFSDAESLIRELENMGDNRKFYQWYFIFNKLSKEAVLSKANAYGNGNRFVVARSMVTDFDVLRRSWVMVDLDPKRESETSSSQEELKYCEVVMKRVCRCLRAYGFSDSVVCCSGNGYHLMLPCDMEVSQESDLVVKEFLKVLDLMFSDERVSIDVSVSNRARLTKLYGTMARKGVHSPERAHRMSGFVFVPEVLVPNSVDLFKGFVDCHFSKPKEKCVYNDFGKRNFNVREFLSKHGVRFKERVFSGGVKYVLEECVFNSEHKSPDAAVFELSDGRLGYKCFHNSCSAFHWKDFRERLEPISAKAFELASESVKSEDLPVWLGLEDIHKPEGSELLHIPTRYEALDRSLNGGLASGGLTVLTGVNGCGKTVFLNNLIMNVCERGFKVGLWSGEMQSWRIRSWLELVARGMERDCEQVNSQIMDCLRGNLFVYNNVLGNDWKLLFDSVRSLVEREGVHLVVLDNLACMSIGSSGLDKYDGQSMLVKELAAYAKGANVHVVLVAHPRKSYGVVRKSDISGSYDLSNMADNVLIMHKVNDDFMKQAKDFWKRDVADSYSKFDSLLELVKNREMGEEIVLGLFYERYSKRLKTEYGEVARYKWERFFD